MMNDLICLVDFERQMNDEQKDDLNDAQKEFIYTFTKSRPHHRPLPLPSPLSHDSTTALRIAFFPRCGNDAICLHYGDDIIQKSSLHLKMQMESQNWAPKDAGGRTEAEFRVRRLAACKRQRTVTV